MSISSVINSKKQWIDTLESACKEYMQVLLKVLSNTYVCNVCTHDCWLLLLKVLQFTNWFTHSTAPTGNTDAVTAVGEKTALTVISNIDAVLCCFSFRTHNPQLIFLLHALCHNYIEYLRSNLYQYDVEYMNGHMCIAQEFAFPLLWAVVGVTIATCLWS